MIRAFSRVGAAGVALIGLVVLWQTQSNAALLVIGLILLFETRARLANSDAIAYNKRNEEEEGL